MKSKWKPYYKLGQLEAREADGHNNDGDNTDNNDKGVHDSPFSREVNSYPNGTGSLPPQGFLATDIATATNLPSARAVSNAVMNGGTSDNPSSSGTNEFFQFFGQALTHDMAEAATGASGDPPLFPAGLPFPFGRTPYELEGGVRQQINEETSFLDLSMVYGNSQTMLDLVRAELRDKNGNVKLDSNGDPIQSATLLMGADNLLPTIKEVGIDAELTSLEVLAFYRPAGFGGLPDPATNPAPATFEDLYFAGDNRVNQTPLLISQQLIWAREHNYQVDKLTPYAKKYGWTQDALFAAARAITEAEWQKVVYDEYLAKLIGKDALDCYSGYDPNVDPSIMNEFTTVAFRFGHDESSQNQKPLNEDGTGANPGGLFTLFTLAEAFAAGADAARTSANIDDWIRGQLSSHTQEIDGLVVDGNRNTLFAIPGGPPGVFTTVDLEVFDIMRARDHGVWNYNELREGFGFTAYASFAEFAAANDIDTSSQRYLDLVNVYGNDINKLDSIIGGLLEKKFMDSQLGETFTKIIALQFENLRDGDKLYYENRFEYDKQLLAEIESTSMTDILKRTTGIDHLYRDAFAAHDRVSDTDGGIDGSAAKDLAVGTNYGEVIKTYDGADDVYAGKGNDYLFAGKGNDWLWTGKGHDIVVLEEYSGYDVVKDFDTKNDKLDLTDYGIDSWKDVKKAAYKSSDGVVIKLDHYNKVELVGVKLSDLSSKNFIYDDDYGYPVV
jgi:peroxidase